VGVPSKLLPLWSSGFCRHKVSTATFVFSLCLCGEKQAKEMRGMGLIYPSKLDALYLCCTGVERST